MLTLRLYFVLGERQPTMNLRGQGCIFDEEGLRMRLEGFADGWRIRSYPNHSSSRHHSAESSIYNMYTQFHPSGLWYLTSTLLPRPR